MHCIYEGVPHTEIRDGRVCAGYQIWLGRSWVGKHAILSNNNIVIDDIIIIGLNPLNVLIIIFMYIIVLKPHTEVRDGRVCAGYQI